jgi:radical SAM protein with 4Fe4S-binding SPASM domain
VGAEFDRWRQSVGEFVTEARQQRGNTLSIGANVVVSKANLHEMADILRLLAELGFGTAYVMHPIPVDDTAADLCASPAELAAVREEDLFALAGGLGLKVHCSFRRRAWPPKAIPRCLQPWEYIFVRVDGKAAPCCALFGSEKEAVMGNIFQEDFAEIWHGQRFREFRRTSAAGTNALCRICPYY